MPGRHIGDGLAVGAQRPSRNVAPELGIEAGVKVILKLPNAEGVVGDSRYRRLCCVGYGHGNTVGVQRKYPAEWLSQSPQIETGIVSQSLTRIRK